jgi:hypothetical protein
VACVHDHCRSASVYTCASCGGQICATHTYRDNWAGRNYCPADAATVQGQAGGIVWRSHPVVPLSLAMPPGAEDHLEFWRPRIDSAVRAAANRDDLLGYVVRQSLETQTFQPQVAAEALALGGWAVELPEPGAWFPQFTDAELRARGLLPREMTALLRDHRRG